jgi:hypothetical protein
MTTPGPTPASRSRRARKDALSDPEYLRRARFQNLIWRQSKARSAHLVGGASGGSNSGPEVPQPDVPVEWLRELDHR